MVGKLQSGQLISTENIIIEVESDANSRSWEFPWESALFFSLTLRNNFLFLVFVSKHEIYRKKFLFSLGKMRFSFKFSEKKIHILDRFFLKLIVLFLKILVNRQAHVLGPMHFISWIEAKYKLSTHQELCYLNFDLTK